MRLVIAQQDADPFSAIGDFLNSSFLRVSGLLLLLLVAVLWISLVYWTYTDASRRGALPLVWGLVAIVFPYAGSLVYLIVRPPESLLDSRERELELAVLERELRNRNLLCPSCRSGIEKDYLICPECGWELKKPCVNCEKPLDLNWEICPYCETRQRTGKRIR